MRRMMFKFRTFLNNESGGVLIIVAFALVGLMGFTALTVDGGSLYTEKSRLQKAADAAALAAAQELPLDSTKAELEATNTANKNRPTVDEVKVEIDPNKKWVRVTTKENVKFTFAKVLGFNDQDVIATAKVELNPMTSGRGVIPLGIQHVDYDLWKNCTEITLKLPKPSDPTSTSIGCDGANNLGSGNTGPLVLTGTGGDKYRDDLKNGSNVEVKVGMELETQTGNMVGPTKQGIKDRLSSCPSYVTYDAATYPEDCERIVTVPIYKIIEFETGNQIKKVEVIGFAVFFLVSVSESSEGAEVKGQLISYNVGGDSSPAQTNYGAYGYKLVD
ncbi:Flp pilus assembly protein TadG [Bacillus mesophilus]|uniref:Putative Flp pilus-assembly TadG-like N-terminal domain-containing protein n=1 Tax=Bacillus mesophilus TaxID=1808955 RepID=A0A6M0Q7J6_9BACI|nr:pilus assembly protein TadG-related protein [Bacillus mesophilus]MBM7661636.1 Flp pilus assembly protein TadG [Bacillus mesophilus]NEY72304.1 hypothetical protein [Bacillus mesophilus]